MGKHTESELRHLLFQVLSFLQEEINPSEKNKNKNSNDKVGKEQIVSWLYSPKISTQLHDFDNITWMSSMLAPVWLEFKKIYKKMESSTNWMLSTQLNNAKRASFHAHP